MLEVKELNKTLSNFKLDEVNFTIPAGYICGLIGKNGSGKSTLIKSILNIYRKDYGKVIINGYDLDENEALAKSEVGIVLDASMYAENLSAKKNAEIFGRFYEGFNMEYFNECLKHYKIDSKRKLCMMSKGMQVKFQIAMAMSHFPKLLIMDEPSANLDEDSRKEFNKMLLDFVNDGTRSVLLSTHLTTQLDEIADYILCIDKGKVKFFNDKESLLDEYQIIRGENYKINLIPSKLVIAKEKSELFTTAFIKKSNIYALDTELKIERPKIDDIMYYLLQNI